MSGPEARRRLGPPARTPVPLGTMLKVLAPMVANWLDKEDFKLSMAVRMPTRAMIPKAMIEKVSTVRSRFCRIAPSAKSVLSYSVIGGKITHNSTGKPLLPPRRWGFAYLCGPLRTKPPFLRAVLFFRKKI